MFLLLSAYKCSFSEYIEALAFYKFLISGEVLLYNEVIDTLQFIDAESVGDKELIYCYFLKFPLHVINFWCVWISNGRNSEIRENQYNSNNSFHLFLQKCSKLNMNIILCIPFCETIGVLFWLNCFEVVSQNIDLKIYDIFRFYYSTWCNCKQLILHKNLFQIFRKFGFNCFAFTS